MTRAARRLLPWLACWSVVLYAACITIGTPAFAQSASLREADIKSAFLYNFARFIDWPADAFSAETAPFRVEIIGRDPFDGRLDQVVAGKTVNRHAITVAYTLSARALPSGHIVVISSSEARRVPQLLAAAAGKPILTVSDIDGFAEAGGVIGFKPEGGNIRFGVNVASAHDARLRIDSRMLAVARTLVKIPQAQSN